MYVCLSVCLVDHNKLWFRELWMYMYYEKFDLWDFVRSINRWSKNNNRKWIPIIMLNSTFCSFDKDSPGAIYISQQQKRKSLFILPNAIPFRRWTCWLSRQQISLLRRKKKSTRSFWSFLSSFDTSTELSFSFKYVDVTLDVFPMKSYSSSNKSPKKLNKFWQSFLYWFTCQGEGKCGFFSSGLH